tara:strand:+ start:2564 stop:2854 length:291 start_codon:yes stop_codon:yes gene_type:complete
MNYDTTPVLLINPEATEAQIDNHIGLRLGHLEAMLEVAQEGNEEDGLQSLNPKLHAAFFHACAAITREVGELHDHRSLRASGMSTEEIERATRRAS